MKKARAAGASPRGPRGKRWLGPAPSAWGGSSQQAGDTASPRQLSGQLQQRHMGQPARSRPTALDKFGLHIRFALII